MFTKSKLEFIDLNTSVRNSFSMLMHSKGQRKRIQVQALLRCCYNAGHAGSSASSKMPAVGSAKQERKKTCSAAKPFTPEAHPQHD